MDKTIGERIADFRRERNIQQDEFAEKIGVSRQTLSQWETGKQTPRADKIYEICACFDVSADYFYANNAENGAATSAEMTPDSECAFRQEEEEKTVLDGQITQEEAPMSEAKAEGQDKNGDTLQKIYDIWKLIRGWLAVLFFGAVLLSVFLVQISPNVNKTTVRVWLVDWQALTVILAFFVLFLCAAQVVRTVLFIRSQRRKKNEEK